MGYISTDFVLKKWKMDEEAAITDTLLWDFPKKKELEEDEAPS